MWEKIISPILGTLLNWVWGVFKEERAESARWKAQALEAQKKSIKEGLDKQLRWAKDAGVTETPTSGSEWNARVKGLYFLVSAAMLASGCYRYVYVESYRPVPPAIKPPVLEDGSAFSPREQVLASYAFTLEQAYAAVREDAIAHNQKNGFSVEETP
jgi:hypothetical protein